MPDYVPLQKSIHRDAGLVTGTYSFALEQAVVPLVAEELPQVLPTMVVGFVRATNDAGFDLVALQALEAGVNVYVHLNGRWIGGYRPAWYRAHPFRLMTEPQTNRGIVCVDEASSAFEKNASEQATRLFDKDAEPTQRTQNILAFLEKLQKATDVTRALVSQLAAAETIVPWPLTARQQGREYGQQVKGLHHIDEVALKSLEPSKLAELVSSGALMVAYAQLMSEHRLQGLSRLYAIREQANQQAALVGKVDLDALFGEDDDELSFDF
jgi:hypothetical protein